MKYWEIIADNLSKAGLNTRSENSESMKKYILPLLGMFVSMAFFVSCQQEGTTVTEEPVNGPTAYMNRPSSSPTR